MKIVRSEEQPWTQAINHGKFSGRRKPLGGEKLSCGLWELPPGKRSFPLHFHHCTEEALFVISGHAKVRTPDEETPLSRGDFVSFLTGGPAHQIVNDSEEPFVYLAISVTQGVDIVEYPDSGKIGCAVGRAPAGKRFMFHQKHQADYFDGEE